MHPLPRSASAIALIHKMPKISDFLPLLSFVLLIVTEYLT